MMLPPTVFEKPVGRCPVGVRYPCNVPYGVQTHQCNDHTHCKKGLICCHQKCGSRCEIPEIPFFKKSMAMMARKSFKPVMKPALKVLRRPVVLDNLPPQFDRNFAKCPNVRYPCDPFVQNFECNENMPCRMGTICCMQSCGSRCEIVVPTSVPNKVVVPRSFRPMVPLKPIGQCPSDVLYPCNVQYGVQTHQCNDHTHCKTGLICCHQKCGSRCEVPITTKVVVPNKVGFKTTPKPIGECPRRQYSCRVPFGVPQWECNDYQHCNKGQLCCHHQCGSRCEYPVKRSSVMQSIKQPLIVRTAKKSIVMEPEPEYLQSMGVPRSAPEPEYLPTMRGSRDPIAYRQKH